MDVLNHLISEELIYALGWTVLHSLWQAMAVAVFLGMLNLLLQRQTAHLRYLVGNISLMFVLLMAVITFIDLYQPPADTAGATVQAISVQGASLTEPAGVAPATLEFYLQQFTAYFNQHLPLIVMMWFLGASIFALRLLGGVAYLQRLKYSGADPVSARWKQRLGDLAGRLGVRRPVQLLESALAATPMVVGHFKPVILMPIGALNALTPRQVEAILAHELAHIARHDYLLHLLQSTVEVFFYYNPAVWWISTYIRTERENCCDDLAVSVCGDSLVYAHALVSLQELCRPAPQLALTLGRKRQYLLNRVRRLLNQPQQRTYLAERITATLVLFLLIILVPIASANPDRDAPNADRPVSVTAFQPLAPLPKIHVDTLPREETTLEVVKGNGKRLKAIIKDRKIQKLEIDGEEIPQNKYSEYEDEIEEYLAISEPPPPPPPPAPPAPPTVTPPTPPTPPAPRLNKEGIRRIEIIKEKDGHRRIIIQGDGNANFEVDPLGGYGFHFVWPDSLEWLERFNIDMGNLDFRNLTDSLDRLIKKFPNGELYFREPMMEDWEEQLREMLEQHEGLMNEQMEQFREHFERLPDSFDFHFDDGETGMNWNFNNGFGEGFHVHGSHFIMNDKIRTRLEEALLADGLVTDTDRYQLKLSDSEFIVNGQRQPEPVARKYRELYEEAAGIQMEEGTTFEIRKNVEE